MAKPSELPTTDLRSDRIELADTQGTRIWALYPYPAPQPPEPPESPLTELFNRLLALARRDWHLLAGGAACGIAFGLAYLFFADAIYVVKTLVHVEVRSSVIRDYGEIRTGSSFVATQAEVLQSPELVTETIRTIGLPEPDPAGPIDRAIAWVESLLGLSPGEATDRVAMAVLATLPALQASPVLGTDVMAVNFRTPDPERGVRFLEELIATYRRYVRENETAAHREGLELLRKHEARLSAQIAEISERYAAEQGGDFPLGDPEAVMSIQRMSLEEHAKARVIAQNRRITVENELEALRSRADAEMAPTPQVLEDLYRAEASLAEMRKTLAERHPDVRQMEERVAGLRAQVRQGAATRAAELEREVRAARRSEFRLGEAYDREWEKAKRMEIQRLAAKKRSDEIAGLEQKRASVLALIAEKELSLLDEGSAHSGALIRVLEAPSIPLEAAWPLPVPVLGACSLVGVMGGLAFALLAEQRRTSRATEPTCYEPEPAGLAQHRVAET